MLYVFVAAVLAVLISLLLAEAEVASPIQPMYSPVIPPGLKTKLGKLCPRIRFDGRLIGHWVVRQLKRPRPKSTMRVLHVGH